MTMIMKKFFLDEVMILTLVTKLLMIMTLECNEDDEVDNDDDDGYDDGDNDDDDEGKDGDDNDDDEEEDEGYKVCVRAY